MGESVVKDKKTINKTEEIDSLFFDYQANKSNNNRNVIFVQFSYIADIAARKFSGRGVNFDDLKQVASIALIKVIERYDIERKIPFTSYAIPSVVGEIKNYFRDYSRSMRISRRNNEAIIKMRNMVEELSQQLSRTPQTEEIAIAMDISVEKVLELLEVSSRMTTTSLNASVGEDSVGLEAFVGEAEEGFKNFENREFLKKAFSRLNEKERFLIKSRYFDEKTQREVAKDMDVSQMYVSRMEKRVLAKLKIFYKS